MKAQYITPSPPRDEVKLTLTAEEAGLLDYLAKRNIIIPDALEAGRTIGPFGRPEAVKVFLDNIVEALAEGRRERNA